MEWLTLDAESKEKAFRIAEWASRRILTEYREAVSALAEVIFDEGQVDMNRIDTIIAQATGRTCPLHGSVPGWLEPRLLGARS